MKPFKNCFAVDIGLSLVGYKHALEVAVLKNKLLPTRLYISSKAPKDERQKTPKQWAEYVLQHIGVNHSEVHLPVVEVDHYEVDQWSLGTEDDYGYGSLG